MGRRPRTGARTGRSRGRASRCVPFILTLTRTLILNPALTLALALALRPNPYPHLKVTFDGPIAYNVEVKYGDEGIAGEYDPRENKYNVTMLKGSSADGHSAWMVSASTR